MAKRTILNAAGREKLEQEYRQLIDVEQPRVIEELTLARSQGDLSENADYSAARDRQAQIESRISEIENILANAMTPEEAGLIGAGQKIGIGDIVVFRDLSTDEELQVEIAGSIGSNPMAEKPSVSNESPLGKALVGREVGDVVRVASGEPYDVEIIRVIR